MLPELPKQNKKREAKFGTYTFKEWAENNYPPVGTYETKDTRGKDYLAFDEVKSAQVAFGYKVMSEKGVLIRVDGHNGEADYNFYRLSQAFVVIHYPKFFCIIEIDAFVKERDRSKRKSLTGERAREIAWKTI